MQGRTAILAAMATVLGACGGGPGRSPPEPAPLPGVSAPAPSMSGREAARSFAEVIARVEPVAEAICRAQTRRVDCDYQIWVDTDPSQAPNAYQTLDANGRPQIVFTIALIANALNADELAFVLGHEAAHHIEGHLAQSERQAITGAIIGGILASATGAGSAGVERAQRIGAQVGVLRYSKEHELEADRLGTMIAYEAGFDPVLGAAFFSRLPDPGDGFLSTHPANADRQAVVAETYAALVGGGT